MKKSIKACLSTVVVAAMSFSSAHASDQPGYSTTQNGEGAFTLALPSPSAGEVLLSSLPGAVTVNGSLGTISVVPGDFVIGNSGDSSTWSEVVAFSNVGGAGEVETYTTLNSMVASVGAASQAVYLDTLGAGTYIGGVYTPDKTESFPQMSYSVVPEPSTYLAGALLLIPFGFSAVRGVRKWNA